MIRFAYATDEQLAERISEAERKHDHDTYWRLVDEQILRDLETL